MSKKEEIIKDQIHKYIRQFNGKFYFKRKERLFSNGSSTAYPLINIRISEEYFKDEPQSLEQSYEKMRQKIEDSDWKNVDNDIEKAASESAFNDELYGCIALGIGKSEYGVIDYIDNLKSTDKADTLHKLDALYKDLLLNLNRIINQAKDKLVVEVKDNESLAVGIMDYNGSLLTDEIQDDEYTEIGNFAQVSRGLQLAIQYSFDEKFNNEYVVLSDDILAKYKEKLRWSSPIAPLTTEFDDDAIILQKDSMLVVNMLDDDDQEEATLSQNNSDVLADLYKAQLDYQAPEFLYEIFDSDFDGE